MGMEGHFLHARCNSECDAAAQRFLKEAHESPHQLLAVSVELFLWAKTDLCELDNKSFKKASNLFLLFERCQAMMYAAGFPCQPFSGLHNNTSLLEEKNAAQFYGVIQRIAKLKPADPRLGLCVAKQLRWLYSRTFWAWDV